MLSYLTRLPMLGALPLAACLVACNHADDATTDGATATPSEQLASVPDAPDIHFATVEHDFGEVTAGVVAEHTFELTNRGKGVLELENPRGS